MGIASLVISIIAIILSLIPVVGLIVAFFALIFAIIAICRKKNKEVYRGLKIAGLIISIIAFLLSLLMTVVLSGGILLLTNLGTDLIEEAQSELSSISGALRGQILEGYAGKTKAGSDILAAVRKYANSDYVSIVITTSDGEYHVGAGRISLPTGTEENDYKIGGIANGTIEKGTTSTYSEMVSKISTAKYYKTALVYDNNDNVIGIAITEITK